ncbi:MAG: hypothetical protein GF375_00240 [Candidatus Omnitrophica bacterium]|nr:hypothetical protein [Candidatus Omnitrophota bacterium]
MFFRIKIKLLKFLKIIAGRKPFSEIAGFFNLKTADEICKDLIKIYAPGKSFLDLGCMWRVEGLFSFFAEECGAKDVTAVDISLPTENFRKKTKERGSKINFFRGDINSEETLESIGCRDVVFCSGLLYHMPEPLFFLRSLRKICRDTLILGSMVIPEINSIKNSAVFYPFLDKKYKNMWSLRQRQVGIKEDFTFTDKYANWFWGLSPSCIISLLKCAGFKLEKKIVRPFHAFFVCRPVEDILEF